MDGENLGDLKKLVSVFSILLVVFGLVFGSAVNAETLRERVGVWKQDVAPVKNVMGTDELRDFSAVQIRVNRVSAQIDEIRERRLSLENELKIIDLTIGAGEEKLTLYKKEVEAKNGEIFDLEQQILDLQGELADHSRLTRKYLKLLNAQAAQPIVARIFGAKTLASAAAELRAFMTLESLEFSLFRRLKEIQSSLDLAQKDLQGERAYLVLWQEFEQIAQDELILQRGGKESLVRETESSEKRFAGILEEERRRERELADDLQVLYEKNDLDAAVKAQLAAESALGNVGEQLRWPVNPRNGLSAKFEDAGYEKMFGLPHGALDIPTAHGTDVVAATYGYVLRVEKPVTNNYAYVILAHSENRLTLYGHLSEISVVPGQMVRAGDVIGKSGGIPGSRGAGFFTTGAHLHFELHEGGVKVDPLPFLPLLLLPFDDVPVEMYGDLEKELGILGG